MLALASTSSEQSWPSEAFRGHHGSDALVGGLVNRNKSMRGWSSIGLGAKTSQTDDWSYIDPDVDEDAIGYLASSLDTYDSAHCLWKIAPLVL